MSKNITQLLDEHSRADEKNFDKIAEELKLIRENHLYHIEKSLESIVNDIDWIKKFFWLFATISVTAILGQILAQIMLSQ